MPQASQVPEEEAGQARPADAPTPPPAVPPAPAAQLPAPVEPKARGISPERAKEWIDLSFGTCDRLVRGVLPLAIGAVGFSEYFAPDFLSGIAMSHELALAMLSAGTSFFGLSLRPGAQPNQGGGQQ
ncbi:MULTISPECIES: hypothetical protein [unclassified Bosea (in: a-proteobacteria)]|uniref:hypothetical protein n=1 Tax=unclassified Bosea (in: a-proteobacteria) TaxID=2653178 RepID=UPI000F754F05|nr:MULTISPECIES: hypothetical protein [unclassified Bosea (in: a-proteobacteria)]AZO77715.1 hypothetical protein BLM15_08870 [Bosea sp. Tri-49]RXT18328.1 hypothetical protein B5U98_24025 [Bosea sp. Tri-39]RXT32924.1 hypothetical protein B5U99_30370 [Bosea sp. Tri-54]